MGANKRSIVSSGIAHRGFQGKLERRSFGENSDGGDS